MSVVTPPSERSTAPMVAVLEDSEEDTEAILRALRKCGVDKGQVDCFYTGKKLMQYLLRQDEYEVLAGTELPQLVFVDLNIPSQSGQSVIMQMKEHETLKAVPLVILTSSNRAVDIETCYRFGINSYITKPLAYSDLVQKLQHTIHYWFDVASIPKLIY